MHWGLGGLAYIQSCFPLPFWDGASVTRSLLPGAWGHHSLPLHVLIPLLLLPSSQVGDLVTLVGG